MISFPHAKINLGLSIVSKRPDGFHNLETIFYPLPIRDVLEIIPSEKTRFLPTGLEIPGATSDNLVMRAYRLLKSDFPMVGPVNIYLHKTIPMGSGLGGGSSDAAATLHLMNRLFRLEIPTVDLSHYALKLGSDCPFFMQSHPCFASGSSSVESSSPPVLPRPVLPLDRCCCCCCIDVVCWFPPALLDEEEEEEEGA